MDGEKKNLGDGVVAERVGPDRWRFEVEMKPFDETTVVSWKEMMRKVNDEPPSDSDTDDSDEDEGVDKYIFARRKDTQETPEVDESGSHVINQEGQQKTSRSKTSVSLKDRTEERAEEIMHSQQNKRKRYELPIPNVPCTGHAQRTASVHMTDASRLAQKKLGWSILQLKKLVKTSNTSLADVKGSGASSLQTENRLHPQFKEKLAKVARQMPLHEGQISEELLDHLMGILRNYFQRKTLKKVLRDMVLEHLFTKKAECQSYKQIKREIVKMIKLQTTSSNSAASPASEVVKDIYNMDDQLEDKLYDLYDTFTQDLDEDAGCSMVRRFYVKLATLWPKGTMNNHKIRQAICRAQDRKMVHS